MISLKCINLFLLFNFTVSNYNKPKFTRRSILITPSILFSNPIIKPAHADSIDNYLKPEILFSERFINTYSSNIIQNNNIDYYAKWSFFGYIPPPIEKVLSYEELLEEIRNNNILTIQIAVQHDCVVATTIKGHRLSCLILDKNFPDLIKDSSNENGEVPFKVLPIDPVKAKIRSVFQFLLGFTILFYTAADLDIIDYDITPYTTFEEREKAYLSGKKPKKYLKSLVDYLFNRTTETDNDNIKNTLSHITHNKTHYSIINYVKLNSSYLIKHNQTIKFIDINTTNSTDI